MNTEPEIDFDDFIRTVFENPPKEPHSIVISMDCEDLSGLYERLITTFHESSIILFGDENQKVNLKELTAADMNRINQYFNSFGVEVLCKACHQALVENIKRFVQDIPEEPISNKDLIEIEMDYPDHPTVADLISHKVMRSNNLEDYKFNIKVENVYFFIWFRILQKD
jgi:hypothetical protein